MLLYVIQRLKNIPFLLKSHSVPNVFQTNQIHKNKDLDFDNRLQGIWNNNTAWTMHSACDFKSLEAIAFFPL